jgi:DNA uptake protein ComE-like DNA-binding protein
MKRTIGITLGALALVLTAAAAFAEDPPATPATPPATTPAATEQKAAAEEKGETKATEKAEQKHAAHHAKAMKHEMVSLNSASKEDLAKLPGIGDETAEKIIAARPFKSRRDLVAKKIVTRAEYRKISGWVSAK